jgi:nucleoside-diphosphate-sugar epimerase
MKVLCIGGTGNLSAECAVRLHELGHEVLVLTRGHSPVPPAFRTIQADRRDPAAMRAALRGVAVEVVLDFVAYDIEDVQGGLALFRNAVQQYIFISSTTVYARPPRRLPLTEGAPLGNRLWDYAQKKVACEQWLRRKWEQERFPVTIVRPSHTYSKRWIPNAISSSSYSFAARLEQGKAVFVHDQGEGPWTLTAASDFAVGLTGLLGRPEALGEAFHITSDEVLTWNQIYAEIADALGVKSPEIVKVPTEFICRVVPRMAGTLQGDKAHPGVFDNAKIKRFVPGFHCRKPLRIGLQESVAWLREHPGNRHLNPDVDGWCDAVVGAWRQRR